MDDTFDYEFYTRTYTPSIHFSGIYPFELYVE